MTVRWIVLLGLGLLSGCAAIRPVEAAGDVHAFLVAVRDDDHRAFEAYVDRTALRAHLQARVVTAARSSDRGAAVEFLGLVLSGPLARATDAVLVQPEVFRAIAEYYGYRPGEPIPSALALSTVLRPTADGAVCAAARRDGPCLLTFALEDGVWRLVDADPTAARSRSVR